MKYLKIFSVVFFTLFSIGFLIGWYDAEEERFEDHLLENVQIERKMMDNTGIVFLHYINNNDTLTTYLVNTNKITNQTDQIILKSLNLKDPAFPFLSRFNKYRNTAINTGLGAFGSYLFSKTPTTKRGLAGILSRINTKLGINNATRGKIIFVTAVGMGTGFLSGYYSADRAFKPSANSDEVLDKINNLNFWEAATLKLWYEYVAQLQEGLSKIYFKEENEIKQQDILSQMSDLTVLCSYVIKQYKIDNKPISNVHFDALKKYEEFIYDNNPDWDKPIKDSNISYFTYFYHIIIIIINFIALINIYRYAKSRFNR